MKVENDAFRKANRAMRQAGADERTVELRLPLGLELDEDKNGNVFVKSIEKGVCVYRQNFYNHCSYLNFLIFKVAERKKLAKYL